MKSFMDEFKEFISRGNVMDMAVGIMIGGAFTAIVTSLVEDIISPILGVFGGLNFDQLSVNLGGEVTLMYGKFITAVINFLIMAFILFSIIKALNAAASKMKKPEEEEAPTTKMCPYCKSEDVVLGATKCPHCGSELELSPEEKEAEEAAKAAAQA
jgi:large conductance mechanosensitive channel